MPDGHGLLSGWSVEAVGEVNGPAAQAAAALRSLGVASMTTAGGHGEEALVVAPADGGTLRVVVRSWEGEQRTRCAGGVTDAERDAGDRSGTGPVGAVAATYVGLLAAARGLAAIGNGRDTLASVTVDARETVTGLVEGFVTGSADRATVIAVAGGWLVARWRDEAERLLFGALTTDRGRTTVDEMIAAARECRLLVAPVRPAPTRPPRVLGRFAEPPGRRREPLRVVDWSPLWAGPSLTSQLAHDGAVVTRVEAPQRRDGLLATPHGRELWRRWNGAKALRLIDAGTSAGRAELRALVAAADVLVTGQTPRVLPQLGLDDDWFATEAAQVFHLALVAFDPPHENAPGLGEHAAASAGLLWRGQRRPYPALPWADPLLAAWGLVVTYAWLAAGAPASGRAQLSLESAAALARSPAGTA